MADTVSLEAIKASATALNECGSVDAAKIFGCGLARMSTRAFRYCRKRLEQAVLIDGPSHAEFCDDAGRSGKPKLGRYCADSNISECREALRDCLRANMAQQEARCFSGRLPVLRGTSLDNLRLDTRDSGSIGEGTGRTRSQS